MNKSISIGSFHVHSLDSLKPLQAIFASEWPLSGYLTHRHWLMTQILCFLIKLIHSNRLSLRFEFEDTKEERAAICKRNLFQ
jgi:hypothetical protein